MIMNILYIADSSSWHNAKWTEYFAERHNVFLFSDYKEEYKPVNFHPNVKIIQLPPLIDTKSRHFNKLVSLFYYASHIQKIIKEYDIDIIHCVAIYYAFLATFVKTNKQIIYTQQGSELLIRAKKSKFYRYMANRVFKRVNIVTGDSKVIQKAGLDCGALKENNYIIQNGVDLGLFTFNKNEKVDIKSSSRPVRLYSPRGIIPLYNIDTIIEALSILKNKSNLSFICQFTFGFGDEHLDGYKAKASRLGVNEFIEWVGYVDHTEMPKYYSQNDIVISIPSSDSSPKSVYESMACGTPVVVSNLPWVTENLTENKSVIISQSPSAESLAACIMKLINDQSLYKCIQFEASNLIRNKFSYSAEMKKMENIMLDSISNGETNSV